MHDLILVECPIEVPVRVALSAAERMPRPEILAAYERAVQNDWYAMNEGEDPETARRWLMEAVHLVYDHDQSNMEMREGRVLLGGSSDVEGALDGMDDVAWVAESGVTLDKRDVRLRCENCEQVLFEWDGDLVAMNDGTLCYGHGPHVAGPTEEWVVTLKVPRRDGQDPPDEWEWAVLADEVGVEVLAAGRVG